MKKIILIAFILSCIILTACIEVKKETQVVETSIKIESNNGTSNLQNTGSTQRPESVIRDYYSALSLKKFDKAYSYISYQMKQNDLYSYAKDYESYSTYMAQELKNISRFDIVNTQITSAEENLIKAKVDIDAIANDGTKVKITGTAELVKTNNEWKILKPY